MPFTQVLTVNDVHIKLAEKELTYQNVTITKGQSYIIRGASGIEKTVFLKTMLALAPFETGMILYDGKNIGQQAQADVFADIRYIQADNTLFDDSVKNNIFFGRQPSQADLAVCLKLLPQAVLDKLSTEALSTGETRRVLLLRGLLSGKSVLVFDEPTANLDAMTSDLFWNLVNSWQEQSGNTLIVVSHTLPIDKLRLFDHQLDFNSVVLANA